VTIIDDDTGVAFSSPVYVGAENSVVSLTVLRAEQDQCRHHRELFHHEWDGHRRLELRSRQRHH
jgi:hypothetical protein